MQKPRVSVQLASLFPFPDVIIYNFCAEFYLIWCLILCSDSGCLQQEHKSGTSTPLYLEAEENHPYVIREHLSQPTATLSYPSYGFHSHAWIPRRLIISSQCSSFPSGLLRLLGISESWQDQNCHMEGYLCGARSIEGSFMSYMGQMSCTTFLGLKVIDNELLLNCMTLNINKSHPQI